MRGITIKPESWEEKYSRSSECASPAPLAGRRNEGSGTALYSSVFGEYARRSAPEPPLSSTVTDEGLGHAHRAIRTDGSHAPEPVDRDSRMSAVSCWRPVRAPAGNEERWCPLDVFRKPSCVSAWRGPARPVNRLRACCANTCAVRTSRRHRRRVGQAGDLAVGHLRLVLRPVLPADRAPKRGRLRSARAGHPRSSVSAAMTPAR